MRWFAAIWAVIGVSALLLTAIWRLWPHAADLDFVNLSMLQWLLLIVYVVFMAYSEGYKGFQKGFSPRVAARVRYLLRGQPRPLHILAAPLFALSLIGAPMRKRVITLLLMSMIAILVVAMKYVAQPWRGIIDCGVLVGLAWGLTSFYCLLAAAALKPDFDVDPEISLDMTP